MSDLSRWIKQGLLVILVPGLAHPGWKLQTNSVAVTSLPDMWMCGGAVRRDANVHSTSQLHIHCAGGAAGLSSSEERVQCRGSEDSFWLKPHWIKELHQPQLQTALPVLCVCARLFDHPSPQCPASLSQCPQLQPVWPHPRLGSRGPER